MVNRLLKIRVKQLARMASEIGLFRILFLIGLFAYLIYIAYVKLQHPSNYSIVSGIFIVLLLSIHIKRKDAVFLKIYTPHPQFIIISEYLLLFLPLLIIMLYFQIWLYILSVSAFIIILSFLNLKTRKRSINTWFQNIIQDDNFEWKAGIRKNIFMLGAVWIASLFTSFFIGSIPIALFVIGIIIMSFYENNESLAMLISSELSPKAFLKRKIKQHLWAYLIFCAPLLLAFLIFHHQYYYIPLLMMLIFSILIVYNILLKYAFYRPNEKMGNTQIFSAIGSISIIVPFVLIIVCASISVVDTPPFVASALL